jgi:hypothetical protein
MNLRRKKNRRGNFKREADILGRMVEAVKAIAGYHFIFILEGGRARYWGGGGWGHC